MCSRRRIWRDPSETSSSRWCCAPPPPSSRCLSVWQRLRLLAAAEAGAAVAAADSVSRRSNLGVAIINCCRRSPALELWAAVEGRSIYVRYSCCVCGSLHGEPFVDGGATSYVRAQHFTGGLLVLADGLGVSSGIRSRRTTTGDRVIDTRIKC